MKIIDVNGKEKEAESIKIIDHEVPIVGPNTKEGEMKTVKYVEVSIRGKHRDSTWKEWYPLKNFKEMNPNIKVK